ncbi:putative baseplate assembly protein [Streptomyces atroolivaceus]|uniref:Baseplate assembly protein n=1 Tax=Streptomyces atroolivaceus TaxID=66869 RepID=A0ABV9VGZ3_STRAZ|nr:putative baseplate assembly protein [Streptomyces atroolivaceus]
MSGAGGCGCGCGGHDERRAPEALYNPPGRTALDHRAGDHGSFLAAMVDRLASPAYPALRGLTVRTPDDPAVGLLDSWAVVGDLLTFHSERIMDEAYLRTANEHRSLALLGRLVGHRPRPGVAAGTHLAYTLDRDPRGVDVEVVVPRGARSNSVPLTSEEESQVFETDADLAARASWNELPVRRRRPALLTERDLTRRSEIQVSGTTTGLHAGDRLLFVLRGRGGDGDPGQRLLRTVARLGVDREEDVTAIGLQQSAPPSLGELVELLREWITEDERAVEDGEPTPDNPNPRPVSRFIADFDAHVLAPLRAGLDSVTSPAALVARLTEPHERLAEAQAVAREHADVAAWFEQLEAMVGEMIAQAAELEPSRPAPATPRAATPASGALQALGAVLPALRGGGVGPSRSGPGPAQARAPLPAPGTDLGARLLAALDPRIADGLYPAWRRSAPTAPPLLHEVQAMRVTAAPFGAMAPLRPVQDERGRVIRQADWPLSGSALTTMRVVFDTAGKVPVRAEFQHTETGSSVQHAENLPSEATFDLGPGRVAVMTRTAQDHDLSWLNRRPADSQEPGVTAQFLDGLPERTLFVSRPADDGRVHVAVHNGEPRSWRLAPGDHRQLRHEGYELTVRYTVGSEPANVVIGVATVPEPANRHVIALDSVQDSVTAGSWVVIERPRKGAAGPDGIPGDPALRSVTTRVTSLRTAVYTDFGITGRGTELTLADPWLDEHDVLLSTIRDAVVHAGGQALRLADEPLGEDVHGNELELAELYDGLRPGRQLIVSGERTDVPAAPATELVTIAGVEQVLDPLLPGDHVHTRLTLTTGLAHRYRRSTVRVRGNVVAASHGESREEPVGSGNADLANQTFALWQAPLTWMPADNPLGAAPVLDIRVDGLLWHRVDSLAGRGPRERVYVCGAAGGRTTVTFGDGVHGARLPTGHENVRARYRFGTGRAANVRADRVTQAVTRPLGVTGVTNPRPATGGADADGPGRTRSAIPLAVSALDRLVSVADYEDFARSRAGIGQAAAREIFDGRRRLVHVTVAGVQDIPIAGDSDVLTALRSSLARYGDSRLPVRVQTRDLVLLLLAARVKVARDHSWQAVEPRLRQALLTRFGSSRRQLGSPAHLSDVLAAAHSVPGVDHVDVDVFGGVPASLTPDGLPDLADALAEPRTTVPARLAAYDEDVHRVTAPEGETLTSVAARYGIALAELLRLNPDITDTRRLAKGRAVCVFRGIRPAQLVLLSPDVPDTLTLTEVTA